MKFFKQKCNFRAQDASITYWVRHNRVCVGEFCKHKGKTPEEMTNTKVRHSSKGLCMYCFDRKRYPRGRVAVKGVSYAN